MRTHDQLLKLYEELFPDPSTGKIPLYVVPLIRYEYQSSDYLYLLYQDIIENHSDRFDVKSVSVWKHIFFSLKAMMKRNVILHYHWLECTDIKSLSGMAYKLICISIFKLFGGTLVWTMHNKMPHNRRFESLNYKIRAWMASRADRIHVHCERVIEDVSTFYNQPASKFRVVEHPRFPAKKIKRNKALDRLNSEKNLSIKPSDTLFLMFGNISSYKQIVDVCKLFEKFPSDRRLLIVGPVKKGQMQVFNAIKKIARKCDNIRLIPHFVPEKMVPYYMNAADCVVFNYRQILTSGGVELARSYGRPVLAPNLGCLAELDSSESDVTLFSTQEELEHNLRTFEPKPSNNVQVPDA